MERQGSTGDALFGAKLYTRENPNYTGRVIVPVLLDKKKQTIVSNESLESTYIACMCLKNLVH